MQFYRIRGASGAVTVQEPPVNRRELREKNGKYLMKTVEFNEKLDGAAFLFLYDVYEGCATMGAICRGGMKLDKLISSFSEALGLGLSDFQIEEITLSRIRNMLFNADNSGYIEDDETVLSNFDLSILVSRTGRSLDFCENVITSPKKDSIYKKAGRLTARETLLPELDRIFAGKRCGKALGHPVHYIIRTDDIEVRNELFTLLLQALWINGRIGSKRYSFIEFRAGDCFSAAAFDALYKSNEGGAVIVKYLGADDGEDDRASAGREVIEKLCGVMKKYRNRVLTVFCMQRECTESKDIFYESLGGTTFIELSEEFVSGERAEGFLKALAKSNGVRADKRLFAALEADKTYLAPDLHDIFDEWYGCKMKTSVYPQYASSATVKRKLSESAPRGSAYEELMGMVGIAEVKKLIVRALNYAKAQKLFSDKGMKPDRPAMHMVFSGNPGTAKTTVARLFAGIMKENGLLSKGGIVEVGRGDLVGKYVGWTAPTIQRKFRKAQGGVLFIDEAYSLVDDRDGSFGDEAINTIVQEMENHRNDVVVIFAGYPEKMNRFLRKNPGLRSRIAFHVSFPDYDADELCMIADLIAAGKGLRLTEDARRSLTRIFDAERIREDFGNGRYVRNLIEKAKMNQAERLLSMDYDAVTKDDVATIRAEDIEAPRIGSENEPGRIGFFVA